MFKKIIIFYFAFFVSLNIANGTTLNEAINLLYKNNNQLKSEKMKIKEAKSAFAGAVLNTLPDIRYSKSLYQDVLVKTLDDVEIDLGRMNKEKKILSIQENASINSVFLDPQRATQMLKVQNLSFRSNEQNLLLQAIASYLDVIRDSKILEAARDNENVLSKYTELVRKRFELGEVTRTDLEQSRSRLSAMQSSRIQADGNLKVSKAIYKKVFGVDSENLIIPSVMPKIPSNFDDLIKLSKSDNIEIQISSLSKKIAKYDIARSVANVLPSVSASASIIKNDDNLLHQGFKEQRVYGVDLSIPIVPRGGSEYTKILQSKYTYNRYVFDHANAELTLEQQVLSAWNDLQTTEANLRTAKSTLEFTTLAMNAVKKEAQYGSRTTLDVLNAELENFNAKVNLIKVQYAGVLSYYKLIAIIGKLDKNIFNN